MSDDWLDAAQQYQVAYNDKQARDAAAAATAEATKRQREAQRAEQARQMQEAMAVAERELSRFMAERGQAAQHLLASGKTFILIGGETEGGYSQTVLLDGHGLRHETSERRWGGGAPPPSVRAASIREAVEYFAYRGQGSGDPERVRRMADWLKQKLDKTAASMRRQAVEMNQERDQ